MTAPGRDTLPPAPDRLPDVFIVGGPKCGTTSLFDWLAEHPDTYLPAKEPNFLSRDVFDARGVPGALQDWDAYLARLCPPGTEGRLTGESTPRTLYSDVGLGVLAAHPSRPKAIAVLRNPIDLVHSLHVQMIRQGVETETDFARAWERASARGSDPEAWRDGAGRMDRRLDYPMFGRLGTRLAAFHAAVPPERRLVLILEEGLSRDPGTVFAEVLGFLGLPPAEIDLSRRNERVELRAPGLHRFAVRARTAGRRAKAALGMDVTPTRGKGGTGMLSLLQKLNARGTAPARLDPVLRAHLAWSFAPEVARVETELGRRVTAWRDWSGEEAKR